MAAVEPAHRVRSRHIVRGGWLVGTREIWRRSLAFPALDSQWRRKVGSGGLWMLVLPPVGWVLALGFRSVAGERLVLGLEPVLPEWREAWEFLRRGLKSVAVILVYYLPFFVLFWGLAIGTTGALAAHRVELLVFVVLVAAFPPLFVLTLPFYYVWRFDWMEVGPPEVTLLVVVFVGITFFLPAAFTQVALSGRYARAYRVDRVIAFAFANLRPYASAWVLSLLVSAAGVASLILAPWVLFWSYLVILFAFTEVLSQMPSEEVRRRFASSEHLPIR